ncbi:MAG: CRISPR system precrRNA processing endoribonuclease RAMP protein Cas6 [Chloroflexota bacterium]|nr:CRISPR system precrRNA processing endoribonuclease RAMP protein Cas6 [Chloroflexota bacterium]
MDADFDLALTPLRLTCRANTFVHLAAHAGAQWRGALWEALRDFACTDPGQQGKPGHSLHCPMCFLLALEANSPRGVNPPRPLIIRPPMAARAGEECRYEAGETFAFDVILVGKATHLYPYVIQAAQRIGQAGFAHGRGRYLLERVESLQPLTHARRTLYEAGGRVCPPDAPLGVAEVAAAAEQLPAERLWLRFLTPTQLTEGERILNRPQMETLVKRAVERLQALEYHYGQAAAHEVWKTRHHALTAQAAAVRIIRDDTRWIRAFSGSQRAKRRQDVSGFVGSALVEGDVRALRSWLVWASLVNVGKNIIKGNGWLEVSG